MRRRRKTLCPSRASIRRISRFLPSFKTIRNQVLAPCFFSRLMRLARTEVSRRARIYAAQIGRPIARVGVRDTKSRWGSCSTKGSLSFSWRLMLAPELVIDYVVAHEVAHLVEMNHSRRFWALLERLYPGWRGARERLELANATLPILKGKR